jgi:hypothetical protein
MFNPIQFYEFGKSRGGLGTITEIGGVSATLGTAQLLATKLAIDINRISNFSVVGADIKCVVSGSYVIPNSCFYFNNAITYYHDLGSLVTDIGFSAFRDDLNSSMKIRSLIFNGIVNLTSTSTIIIGSPITEIFLGNCVSISNNAFESVSPAIYKRYIYIPKCTSLGTTVLDNNVFRTSLLSGSIIVCHPSLANNNGGGVDGDIQSAISQGAIIRYKTNEITPIAVNDLNSSVSYSSAIQLNFTPSSSTNGVDYYECFANGIFKNKITSSGGHITGLVASTSYVITVVAVDIFYNKSPFSNSILITTNSSPSVFTGLVSYYNLNLNSNDFYGSNNGVDTKVIYDNGKVGNAAVFVAFPSYILLGNNTNIQLTTTTLSIWAKVVDTGNNYRALVAKQNAYGLYLLNGILGFYNWGSFGGAGFRSTGINLNGLWHHVVLVFESGTANNQIYVDGVLKLTFSASISNQNTVLSIGSSGGVDHFLKGTIDEVAIYNTKLTQTEITQIYNNGNGITL